MLSVFLPCRKGSQRVPDKNVKPFAGVKGGLLEIKLSQLVKTPEIDRIVVSSNDERVLNYSASLNNSKIFINERPEHLGSSETSTDQVIEFVPEVISEGDVLWTHVTSPFITSNDYSDVINTYYREVEKGFDSLMTVKAIHSFLWDKSGPINYKRENEKWPRTQTIQPLYEVDSGIFINSIKNYKLYKDRIAKNPFFYQQPEQKSLDIDWPEDFELAEFIYKNYFD